MSTPSNSQEYKITEATIFAERFAEEYNLTSYVGEISFFEDLNRPYVTGQIVIMDDIGVFDEIKLRGSEQIRLKIESNPQGTSDANLEGLKIEMIMNIVSIVQAAKVGERSEVYHLNLISPHAYRDANKKISRSYTGKFEEIAAAIMRNHLDLDIDYSYIGGWSSMQGPVKIITPYISPLESVEWLLSRATTLTGSPIYCWQTIYDQVDGKDKVRFGSLEYMMNLPSFN
jgi:prophage maintenance system killer protein